MKTDTVVLILVLIVSVILILGLDSDSYDSGQKQNIGLEGFSNSPISNEALQAVASIYNSKNMAVTNLNATASIKTDALTATSFNLLPKGIIVAWNGTTPPDGWLLCDGQNDTPDLRGRFIYGYGARRGAELKAAGGAEYVTLTVDQIPPHAHNFNLGWGDQNWNHGFGNTLWGPFLNRPFTTQNTGGGQAHENMPPYYVLAYIMKS